MKLRKLLAVIGCAAIILSSKSAAAQSLSVDGKFGPKTEAAIKCAIKLFKDFPESRGNYLPPGFTPNDFEVDRPIQYLNSSVESLAMVNGGPAKNLSEQHFYYHGEPEGDSQLSVSSMQLSALTASLTLDAFDAGNWGIFYER